MRARSLASPMSLTQTYLPSEQRERSVRPSNSACSGAPSGDSTCGGGDAGRQTEAKGDLWRSGGIS